MNAHTYLFSPNVIIHNGKAVTSSQSVADYFNKLHKNVIQKIESLNCSPEFTRLNFQLSEYTDSTGRKLPMYVMTKDGFVFLVMGFTGKKAASFKEAYISEFNRMEAELLNQSSPKTTTNQRTPLRDAVNMLVGKKGIMYPEAYGFIHQRFNVAHIDDLAPEQLPEAIEYIHKLALEGEYLGKAELPAPKTGIYLDDDKFYQVYFLLRKFTILRNTFIEYKLHEHLTGLGCPAGSKMIGHFNDGYCGTLGLQKLTNEFDAVQKRLGVNQYSAF